MATDIHNKDFALRPVLKERLRGTRKWRIILCNKLSLNHEVNQSECKVMLGIYNHAYRHMFGEYGPLRFGFSRAI